MNNKLLNVIMFAVGATIGSAVTWKLVKDKYEQIANDDIASVREEYKDLLSKMKKKLQESVEYNEPETEETREHRSKDDDKDTIKEEKERVEYRYFISSLPEDIELASRAIRGHWSIESMHWHLDVTFREDANTTIDKTAAQNLNIIRKWCLSILKVTELSKRKLSMKKKRFAISLRPTMLLEVVLNA